MPIDAVRDAAVDVLLRVFERDVYLDASLDKTLRRKTNLSERGRRFLTQIVYGTVRHRRLCDHVLSPLVKRPLHSLPGPILAILRMGVFQSLFCSQVTTPAMVHTSVELAKHRGHAGTARLVNAVLRRAPRDLAEVTLPDAATDLRSHLAVRYSLPDWLAEEWLGQFGAGQARALCEALNRSAPTTIRVNTRKSTPEQLVARLKKAGFTAAKQTAVPEELTLLEGGTPVRSKLFQEGYFMVQDPASMLAAHLMEPAVGERILDCCASPGGKATHLAQLLDDTGRVVAMDRHPSKVAPVVENAERLGLGTVCAVCANGARPPFAGGFARVLVDAPCSGLGTLRRHPDLKWRMTREMVKRLAREQYALLRSAVGLCQNGGVVVYSVCTFSRQETEGVVQAILQEQRVVLEDGPEWLNPWRIDAGTYRTLPLNEDLDGFFLTRFRKRS